VAGREGVDSTWDPHVKIAAFSGGFALSKTVEAIKGGTNTGILALHAEQGGQADVPHNRALGRPLLYRQGARRAGDIPTPTDGTVEMNC